MKLVYETFLIYTFTISAWGCDNYDSKMPTALVQPVDKRLWRYHPPNGNNDFKR